MSPDEHDIRDTIARWMRASKTGDTTALASMLADDVLLLTAGAPPFGKKEFLAGGGAAPEHFEGRADVLEAVVAGNWAWTRCDLAIDYQATRDAPRLKLAGQTLSVWRKEAGRWVIARDANFVAPR